MNNIESTISIIKDLVCTEGNLLVFHNDEIAYKNFDADYQNNTLSFNNSGSYQVFYIVDRDIEVHYVLKSDIEVSLLELFFDIKSDITIHQEQTCFNNSKIYKTSMICSKNKKEVKRLAKSLLYENSYIKLDNLSLLDSKATSISDYYLLEKNASVELQNAVINSSNNIQNYQFNVHHIVPNTVSNMITYGVSKNNSILNINTDGIIKKGSSKTILNQKTKGIILDEKSKISANPILEIDEYDVIASHGASIGAIDDEELYYLMSRGLTRNDSEKLIINGLFNPFINSIKAEKLKEFVLKEINDYL